MKTFYQEMTFSAGKQDFNSNPDFTQSKKIGEFNGFDVMQCKINDFDCYGLNKNNQIYCWIFVKPNNGNEIIHAIRTMPEIRRQHLAENLLFWLKSYLKKSFIFGDTMSNDGIEWIKGLANSGRFNVSWLNIKTDEKHKYNSTQDANNIEPYRSLSEPTDWRILIESYQGNFFYNKYNEWNQLGIITDLFC